MRTSSQMATAIQALLEEDVDRRVTEIERELDFLRRAQSKVRGFRRVTYEVALTEVDPPRYRTGRRLVRMRERGDLLKLLHKVRDAYKKKYDTTYQTAWSIEIVVANKDDEMLIPLSDELKKRMVAELAEHDLLHPEQKTEPSDPLPARGPQTSGWIISNS